MVCQVRERTVTFKEALKQNWQKLHNSSWGERDELDVRHKLECFYILQIEAVAPTKIV